MPNALCHSWPRWLWLPYALLLVSLTASAPQAAGPTPQDVLAMARVGTPVLDPGGARAVYVVSHWDAQEARRENRLWMLDLASGESRPLTFGAPVAQPSWSPEGDAILFSREGQLWRLPLAGGEAMPVTDLPLAITQYAVNPDPAAPPERRMAVSVAVHLECRPADFACSERARERWDQRPGLVSEEFPLRHWSGWRDSTRAHVLVGDPQQGQWRAVTRGRGACPPFALAGGDAFAFTPDGTGLVLIRNLAVATGGAQLATSTDNREDRPPAWRLERRVVPYQWISRTRVRSPCSPASRRAK